MFTTLYSLHYRRWQAQAARETMLKRGRVGASVALRSALWRRVTAALLIMVLQLTWLSLCVNDVAQAATIADPRAPIVFAPTITQTSTGIPVVNIAAPNANGISVNQYQSFDVGSSGLVLNNSLVGGTPFLGGTVGANSNLAGHAASMIVNQVLSTGNASSLIGTLEVFGSPATIVISNPNGVSVNGLSLINASNLVLSTGTVQFLTAPGGTSTSFSNAGALAYNVTSGAISVSGPAGVNGPGTGINASVGNIDLIGQTISLAAPVNANVRVNLIAGNQLVSSVSVDSTGTTYATSSNGSSNTSSAIANGSNNNVAIDASQYGTINSGQIYIVSTAAGMGVRNLGTLAATAGNVSLSANGDVTVGTTAANQNLTISNTGNTTITGTGFANEAITISSGGDLTASGSLSAVTGLSLSATGDLTAAAIAANNNATLTAGGNLTVGSASAASLNLTATSGSVTVNNALTVAGAIQASAGQDVTVNGSVQGGSTVNLSAARNATINGSVSGVGTTDISAQTGAVQIAGSVSGGSTVAVNGGSNVNISGAVSAVSDLSLAAGTGNLTATGSVSTGGNLTASAAGSLSTAAVTSVGSATLTATSGSATLGGAVLTGSDLAVTAGTDAQLQGNVQSLGKLTVHATGNLSATGTVASAGNATLNAGQTLTLGGQATFTGNATLTGNNITTQGMAVGGNLSATAQNTLDVSAGQLTTSLSNSSPVLQVNGNASLSGANVTTANMVIGGAYSATGSTSLSTGGTAVMQGNATLTGGTISNVGEQIVTGTLTANGSALSNSGTLLASSMSLNASGSLINTGTVMATNVLTVTAASLNNSNGLLFAGNTSNPTTSVGNATITVSGGNGSFINTNGQILAEDSLTVTLPNQVINPLAATTGTLNAGNAFNLSALGITNSGNWVLPDVTVNLTASQSITNSGTIQQSAGTLTMNGAVSNSGTITAQELTINGSLSNQANAVVQANDVLTLNGSGANAGTVSALNTINITGANFDNTNGKITAGTASSAAGSGNLNINLTGTLNNAGGTITAINDLAIAASSVVNSAAGNTVTTTTTTTVNNSALLLSTLLGTYNELINCSFCNEDSGNYLALPGYIPITLGNFLTLIGDTADATSASSSSVLYFNSVATSTNDNGSSNYGWSYVSTNASPGGQTLALVLPTVTETTTTSITSNVASTIAAGRDLTLTANSLNNVGGTVSAARNATLNVQSLANGGITNSSTVTDTVDAASLNAFLTTLRYNTLVTPGVNTENGDSLTIAVPGTVTSPTVSSSLSIQGATGKVVAGNNLNLSGGNLVNAGTLMAGNDVNIAASSFTNQGSNFGTLTTTQSGISQSFLASVLAASNSVSTYFVTVPSANGISFQPTSDLPTSNTVIAVVTAALSSVTSTTTSYSYQQTNSTVAAGNDLVIAAATVNNTYGTLAAGRNVVIGGAGTTASDASTSPVTLTQAASLSNTSGAIAAGSNVNINAATLTNTITAPVQVYLNYGTGTPFTGCTGNCVAYVDVPTGDASTITANNNVNLQAVTLNNTGSLITALNSVSITATGSATNSNQTYSAYWSSLIGTGAGIYTVWGCVNNISLCQSLYGGAFNAGDTQDPAGSAGAVGLTSFSPGTIQAGNRLSVSSPTLGNSGNVIGTAVSLSGSSLVNDLTNPNVYTPTPVVSGQVISLGPISSPSTTVNSAGLVTTLSGQPTSVSGSALGPNSPVGVTTTGVPTLPMASTSQSGSTPTYVVNSAVTQVISSLSPSALLAQLPASLQPATTQFYYDPATEDQQIEKAALEATGKSSFYSTTAATDSTSQSSIATQDKAALYGASLQYAEQNNVDLGTQLSAAQLAQVTSPMLWYTEQTVPVPGCTATGNAVCPTTQALMPEILLPQNYASVNADGEISGSNVALNYSNSILNTGSVAAQSLSVATNSLTNEERSTNLGASYQVAGLGAEETTGTLVQQGGYLSAQNLTINAQSIDAIGGAIQQLNADGSVDAAGTAQVLANLSTQLGSNFTQSSAANDIHNRYIAPPTDNFETVFMIVAAVALSIVTAGDATAVIGEMAEAASASVLSAVASGATFAEAASVGGIMASAAFAEGGIATVAISAAAGAMASNAFTQLATTGSLNVGNVLESGAVLGLTAGLTQGLVGNTGMSSLSNGVVQSNSAVALSNLPTTAVNIGEQSLISAAVKTTIEGGSFGTALRDSVVNNVAAVGANAIGNTQSTLTDDLGTVGGDAVYIAAHGLLGCAASAAEGTGCAGGAIGGATSAVAAETIAYGVTGGQGNPSSAQLALITGGSMLLGGAVASVLGKNPNAAETAAENETLNNTCGSENPNGCGKVGGILGAAIGAAAAFIMSIGADEVTVGVNIPATPAEIAAGARTGANIGSKIGSIFDTPMASQGSSDAQGGSGGTGGTGGIPKGYTQNSDGTVTGPQGATYTPTGVQDVNGNQVFQSGSGGYYTLNVNGAATSPAPSTLAGQTPGNIVAAN